MVRNSRTRTTTTSSSDSGTKRREVLLHQAGAVDLERLDAGDGEALAAALPPRPPGASALRGRAPGTPRRTAARRGRRWRSRARPARPGCRRRAGRAGSLALSASASSTLRGSSRIRRPMRTPNSSVSTPLTVVRLTTSRTPSISASRRDRRSIVASVVGREDVVGEQADDGRLLAAEDGADALVVGAVGIVVRQQVVDRAVDADLRREPTQHQGERGDRGDGQPRRAQRDAQPPMHGSPEATRARRGAPLLSTL